MHSFTTNYQMFFVFFLTIFMLVLYATEKFSVEGISFFIMLALALFFHIFPVYDAYHNNTMSIGHILNGFAAPALITILSLIIIGEALCASGFLNITGEKLFSLTKSKPQLAYLLSLFLIIIISSVLNNVPTVVIFIPLMRMLAQTFKKPEGLYMMPISFASILGGMLTLIGSSTNILVADIISKFYHPAITFFTFFIPALILVVIGLCYLVFVAPYLLPQTSSYQDSKEKKFITQLIIKEKSPLIGLSLKQFNEKHPWLKIRRYYYDNKIKPLYQNLILSQGGSLILESAKEDIARLIALYPDSFYQGEPHVYNAETQLYEAMITPQSYLIGKKARKLDLSQYHTHMTLVGIDCRTRPFNENLTNVSIQEGDILLLKSNHKHQQTITHHDFYILDHDVTPIPQVKKKWLTLIIFLATILLAASHIVPVVLAALGGALAVVMARVISMRQALRMIDSKIAFLIAVSIAIGHAMQQTGGTLWITRSILQILPHHAPALVLSLFFLLVATLSNILSTKTTAVIFAPVAIYLAYHLHVSPLPFAIAVIFASNCAFASPIGYQTNLLVMAPGHYRFFDFIKVGLPLMLLCWVAFSLFMPFWYHIPY